MLHNNGDDDNNNDKNNDNDNNKINNNSCYKNKIYDSLATLIKQNSFNYIQACKIRHFIYL